MTRLAPLLALAILLLCGCASQDKQLREAEELSGHKDPYSFHRSVSYSLLRIQQHERAVPHIRRLLSTKPEEAEPHYLMGWALLGMKMTKQAEKEIRKAVELDEDEDFAPAHAMLGVLLDTLKRHQEALKAHRRSIQLDKKSASYHNNLGFSLYLQGRYGEAVVAYKKALDLQPAAPRIHNNLGFALARVKRYKLAFKHFKLAGNEVLANNNMGLAYEQTGDLERAYKHYLKAFLKGSKETRTEANLVRVCKKLGRPVPGVLKVKNMRTVQVEVPKDQEAKK
jgi:Flp pilus assembly protein TadD